jgi:hypothetical protein
MTITDAIDAINTAADRHAAMRIANAVAMESMDGSRPYADELAVRKAWFERWGNAPQQLGYAGPRVGTNWTGD